MSTGVLLYCFDTPEVAYHKFAKTCIKLIKKNLKLTKHEITVVTNFSTFEQFDDIAGLNIKLIENKTGNKRPYRGKNISWNNLERSLAYEHSPYDTTILMDVDYFCFTDNLLTYTNTKYDFLVHNKVYDLTGNNMILGKNESTLPLVWATATIFRKSKFAKQVFDLIKHIQQYYEHYRHLYRIKFRNYRNDYAFAIALHQLNGMNVYKNFIPTPMAMLAHEVDVLEMSDTGIMFKYGKKVGAINNQDVHVMDKEFING